MGGRPDDDLGLEEDWSAPREPQGEVGGCPLFSVLLSLCVVMVLCKLGLFRSNSSRSVRKHRIDFGLVQT